MKKYKFILIFVWRSLWLIIANVRLLIHPTEENTIYEIYRQQLVLLHIRSSIPPAIPDELAKQAERAAEQLKKSIQN